MRSSLASGKSSTPPARCIHRPLRDTSSAGYRLLVSLASCGASRELSSRRSPAHPSSDRLRGSLRSGDTIPHTCAISPTFRCGAILFVAFALAAVTSARLACPRQIRRGGSVDLLIQKRRQVVYAPSQHRIARWLRRRGSFAAPPQEVRRKTRLMEGEARDEEASAELSDMQRRGSSDAR